MIEQYDGPDVLPVAKHVYHSATEVAHTCSQTLEYPVQPIESCVYACTSECAKVSVDV